MDDFTSIDTEVANSGLKHTGYTSIIGIGGVAVFGNYLGLQTAFNNNLYTALSR